MGVGDRSNFWGTLTKISPFVRAGVIEAISHGAIGTVDHSSAPWMLDTGHSFFILRDRGWRSADVVIIEECVTDGVDGLGDDAFGLMANLLAVYLADCQGRILIERGRISTW